MQRIRLAVTNLYSDYLTASKDTLRGIRDRPLRALGYVLAGAGAYSIIASNPSFVDYRNALVSESEKLLVLSPSTRNPVSYGAVSEAKQKLVEGRLRRKNYILFSLITEDETSDKCKAYRHRIGNLGYMHPFTLDRYTHNIVDVGVVGHWLLLDRAMENYDVAD